MLFSEVELNCTVVFSHIGHQYFVLLHYSFSLPSPISPISYRIIFLTMKSHVNSLWYCPPV